MVFFFLLLPFPERTGVRCIQKLLDEQTALFSKARSTAVFGDTFCENGHTALLQQTASDIPGSNLLHVRQIKEYSV